MSSWEKSIRAGELKREASRSGSMKTALITNIKKELVDIPSLDEARYESKIPRMELSSEHGVLKSRESKQQKKKKEVPKPDQKENWQRPPLPFLAEPVWKLASSGFRAGLQTKIYSKYLHELCTNEGGPVFTPWALGTAPLPYYISQDRLLLQKIADARKEAARKLQLLVSQELAERSNDRVETALMNFRQAHYLSEKAGFQDWPHLEEILSTRLWHVKSTLINRLNDNKDLLSNQQPSALDWVTFDKYIASVVGANNTASSTTTTQQDGTYMASVVGGNNTASSTTTAQQGDEHIASVFYGNNTASSTNTTQQGEKHIASVFGGNNIASNTTTTLQGEKHIASVVGRNNTTYTTTSQQKPFPGPHKKEKRKQKKRAKKGRKKTNAKLKENIATSAHGGKAKKGHKDGKISKSEVEQVKKSRKISRSGSMSAKCSTVKGDSSKRPRPREHKASSTNKDPVEEKPCRRSTRLILAKQREENKKKLEGEPTGK